MYHYQQLEAALDDAPETREEAVDTQFQSTVADSQASVSVRFVVAETAGDCGPDDAGCGSSRSQWAVAYQLFYRQYGSEK